MFDMHGNQIAEGDGPGQHFIVFAQQLRQLNHGQCAGYALIAASGSGHHGHCAAVHPCIGGRSRSSNDRIRHIIAEQIDSGALAHLFADLKAIVSPQSLIRNRLIHSGTFQ
ncbi:hypothetical protein D3C75_1095440 [compost metagenome]